MIFNRFEAKIVIKYNTFGDIYQNLDPETLGPTGDYPGHGHVYRISIRRFKVRPEITQDIGMSIGSRPGDLRSDRRFTEIIYVEDAAARCNQLNGAGGVFAQGAT
eukprot:136564-Pleurochrysis_carterae.AAC.1